MRARARAASRWGARLQRARNTLALVMLGALFALRAGVSWRRWQRRRLLAAADRALYQAKAAGGALEHAAEGSAG